MAFDIKPGFKRVVLLSFAKADGTPGIVEGSPVVEMDNPDLATLNVAADGMSYEVVHNGAVGPVRVSVRADGDLGAGPDHVFPILMVDDFNMLAPLGATTGTTSVGEEVPA